MLADTYKLVKSKSLELEFSKQYSPTMSHLEILSSV